LDGFGAKACGGQPGFFDVDDRLKRLSDLGDQLETFGDRSWALGFHLTAQLKDAARAAYNGNVTPTSRGSSPPA
jgi:hypothetical protein